MTALVLLVVLSVVAVVASVRVAVRDGYRRAPTAVVRRDRPAH